MKQLKEIKPSSHRLESVESFMLSSSGCYFASSRFFRMASRSASVSLSSSVRMLI